ncbi:MAG: hypothetical protein AAB428_00580, partial [Patescibacteria group bacterium]
MSILDFFRGKKQDEAVPILPQEIYEAATLELKDIIAPSALKIEPRAINLGDKVARTFFVISYPSLLSDNWFSPVLNLDKVFDIS